MCMSNKQVDLFDKFVDDKFELLINIHVDIIINKIFNIVRDVFS